MSLTTFRTTRPLQARFGCVSQGALVLFQADFVRFLWSVAVVQMNLQGLCPIPEAGILGSPGPSWRGCWPSYSSTGRPLSAAFFSACPGDVVAGSQWQLSRSWLPKAMPMLPLVRQVAVT